MSSFRWGMIASPTPTNSQVTVWELRHLLFSSLSSLALLTVLHSEVHLGSADIPPHFGLSFCNALEKINPPYPIWKGTSLAFIWGIEAYPAPSIYRDMALVKDLVNPPSYTPFVLPLTFVIAVGVNERVPAYLHMCWLCTISNCFSEWVS